MILERTSVWLDVHARSVVAAGLESRTGEVFKQRVVPASEVTIEWLRGLPGPVAATYEAGPTGFGLHRAITTAGIRCEVAAPSKLNRPAGDRVKTDAKDALLLAQLLQLGQIVAVRVPSITEEAARDLVRAREDVRGDLMRPRHRVSKSRPSHSAPPPASMCRGPSRRGGVTTPVGRPSSEPFVSPRRPDWSR